MEYKSAESFHVSDENSRRNEATESNLSENEVKHIPKLASSSPGNNIQVNVFDKNKGTVSHNAPVAEDTSGDVNMEASITPDDVIRAGGFGARDDISSFLPVASDSSDFEATILDARNYEEPLIEIRRPGLGWTEATERK